MKPSYCIFINLTLSCITHFGTFNLIPKFREMFLKANIFGIDMNKSSRDKIPEAVGVICGCVYLIFMFNIIPVMYSDFIEGNADFPYQQFVETLASLLSICCMLLLGFADDVLDLRWRHKLLLPTVASLPLLMVYYVTFNSTTIIVPKPFRQFFGLSVNLGLLYYVYMGMLAVFCTNAINILAGVNGLEVGQSVVIASSIAVFNLIEMTGDNSQAHFFSLQYILPYIGVSSALLRHNWYPAQVFVGDTFCYFSGMMFAVVGILGHFSKTVLLFFIPQVINFLYSVPQLFKILPCPRHRMPRLNEKTGLLEMSKFVVTKKDLIPGLLPMLRLLSAMKFLFLEESADAITLNNMTIINLMIVWFGPLHESTLTLYLLVVQIIGSCMAFSIRYPLAYLFYDHSW